MGYFSWKEDEAYRDGYNDAQRNTRDHFRDEHFGNDSDRAYYDGQKDYEREEQRRNEMYEEERRQEERQERQREEHHQYMRDLEEQEYYAQIYAEDLKNREIEQYTKSPDDDLPF